MKKKNKKHSVRWNLCQEFYQYKYSEIQLFALFYRQNYEYRTIVKVQYLLMQ